MLRRRIWCETLPYDRLRTPPVLSLLRSYALDILLAVRPYDLAELPQTLRACTHAGVSVTLWPMVANDAGRWASTRNATVFTTFALETLRTVQDLRDASPAGMVIDLEPSVHTVAAMFSYTPVSARKREKLAVPEALAMYTRLVAILRDRGIPPSAAVIPLCLYDPLPPAFQPWQRAMGTPVDALPWDHVTAMLYTSIFEGWSRGFFRRPDAVSLLADGCLRVHQRFGLAAGASLGAVGVGALGDEPVYRAPQELSEDVAVARACGIDDLALFDLGGVLARPPAEAWLDAFTHTPPLRAAPPLTLRARVSLAAAHAPGAMVRLLGR